MIVFDSLGKYKIFYFLYFFGAAFVSPFWTVFLNDVLRWTPSQIGLMSAAQAIGGFLASPAYGFLADRTGKYRLLFFISLTLSPLLVLLVALVAEKVSHVATFLLILLVRFARSGVVPLSDRSVVGILESKGENRSAYGRIRLYGAAGWGVSALVIGLVVDQFNGDVKVAFYATPMFSVLIVASAFFVHVGPSDKKTIEVHENGKIQEETVDEKKSKLFSFESILFFIVVTGQGLLMGVIANNLFVYLSELNASKLLLGLSLTFTCVAEVPIFRFSQQLIQFLTPHGTLLTACVCLAIRLWSYSMLDQFISLYFILFVELLHGVTYGAMWAASVSYAASIAPVGKETTVQGVVGGLYFGLGAGMGSFAGGLLMQSYGGKKAFQYAAMLNTGLAIFYAILLIGLRCLERWRAKKFEII